LPGANLEEAATTGVKPRTLDNVQSCIALYRSGDDCRSFQKKFVRKMEELRLGDPFDEKTDVGPLAKADAVASLHEDVQKTVQARGRILTE
jgi:succinate-semialdehyde dehydrogenase/glutarate-semialdehyde dehydrogenase